MDEARRLDLRFLLARAEAAAPVGVVGAMAGAMAEMLGARDVSFLIADYSGRSLTRLGHVDASGEPGSRARRPPSRSGCTVLPTATHLPRNAPWCCGRAMTLA